MTMSLRTALDVAQSLEEALKILNKMKKQRDQGKEVDLKLRDEALQKLYEAQAIIDKAHYKLN